MQLVLKAGLAVSVLLGSTSAAVAAPSSQLLALNQPIATVQRTALPTCSRTVTTNCATIGSREFNKSATPFIIGGVVLGVTGLAIALRSDNSTPASP